MAFVRPFLLPGLQTTLFLTGVLLALFVPAQESMALTMYTTRTDPAGVSWPLFNTYLSRFVQKDGRVIDWSRNQSTTSEGQAYALFFSLAADNPDLFRTILTWTEHNLAGGDLARHLPAWLWGKKTRKRWEVLDSHSASDADLWIAYALLEAGRLWHKPSYRLKGLRLLRLIRIKEVRVLPGLGPILLPGPTGFQKGHSWRINPSYAPVFLLRSLFVQTGNPLWIKIARNIAKGLKSVSPIGLVPDWLDYTPNNVFSTDSLTGPTGSFDAARVYLWTAMTWQGDPLRKLFFDRIKGMLKILSRDKAPPVTVNVQNGSQTGSAPPSLIFAFRPFVRAFDPEGTRWLSRKSSRPSMALSDLKQWTYYDFNMALFSEGYLHKRFSFDRSGHLMVMVRGKRT
ncbi:MAG: cellulose synthase complex periplasmic endoglucanase BcsZ [Leptospirales bacterium]